jgi:hypothetical protein
VISAVAILAFALFGVLIIGIPFAAILISRMGSVTKKETWVLNRNSHRTNQRAFGPLISKEIGRNGRLHIKYLAKDCNEEEVVEVITEANKVIPYAVGTQSGEKAWLEVLPEDAESYVSNVCKNVELKNAENIVISAHKEGFRRAQMHAHELGMGELSARSMEKAEEFEKQLLSSANKDGNKPRAPIYGVPYRNEPFGER